MNFKANCRAAFNIKSRGSGMSILPEMDSIIERNVKNYVDSIIERGLHQILNTNAILVCEKLRFLLN